MVGEVLDDVGDKALEYYAARRQSDLTDEEIFQLFTRPVARLDPYSTPNPRIFICSASTPPGGGVHGMCGYHAAQSALKQLERGGHDLPLKQA